MRYRLRLDMAFHVSISLGNAEFLYVSLKRFQHNSSDKRYLS